MKITPFLALIALSLTLGMLGAESPAPSPQAAELTVIVMDPLALPLSCPCVKGYAQRDYDKLAAHLQAQLKRPVSVTFSDSLTDALKKKTQGKADLIIGKRSVVEFDAKANKLALVPVADLSGKDGVTTMTGLIVVPKNDPAKTVADLKDYRIIFGTQECDEKYAAPLALLKSNNVTPPAKLETSASCADGATAILEAKAARGAAVISSYAKPLLEGCGTINKGDLRVVGETAPVPFITAFVSSKLSETERKAITDALLQIKSEAALCTALETKGGFVQVAAAAGTTAKKKLGPAGTAPAWPGWRGPGRDGLVATLPATLPAKPQFLWKKKLSSQGLGGVAATERFVVVVDRDFGDAFDVFRCLDATTGADVWTVRWPAQGNLDYGNSPRATPLIHGDWVYLYGAFGHLHSVELATGRIVWRMDVRLTFGAEDKLTWGMASSPLVVDDKLIINPGGPEASLVALEPATGKVIWKTPGAPSAFASFIVATFGRKKQLVGYDNVSLGGWNAATGERLWQLFPKRPRDYNVPTPIVYGDRLLVATENNGTRLYAFDNVGRIVPEPVAVNADLAPDTHTPVIVGDKLYGVWNGLHCLDLKDQLRTRWLKEDEALEQYANVVASPERLLISTQNGELLLVDVTKPEFALLSRVKVFPDETGTYAHPAIVGDRLYLRSSSEIVCLVLGQS